MSEKKKLQWENDYQVGSGANFTCAKFGNEASLLAGGDDLNQVILWKVTNNKPKVTLTGQKTFATAFEFAHDSKRLYSGTDGGTVHVWDLLTAQEKVKLQGHMTRCTALSCAEGDNQLVTGSKDTKVKLWDTRVSSNIATFRKHTGTVNTLQMSPDAKWIASGSEDGCLKIWDVTADKEIANFYIPGQSVTCLQFNPKTLTIANGSSDHTVKYWDLETMSIITRSFFDVSPIHHITFSGDNSNHLFSCSSDYIRLWNIESNHQLDFLQVPPKPVADFTVSTQKRFLFLTTIQANTLSVYCNSLECLNFDETVDTVPSSDHKVGIQKPKAAVSKPKTDRTADVEMKQEQQKQKVKTDQVPRIQSGFKQPVSKANLANDQTYFAAPKDQPIGIKMEDFIMNEDQTSQDLQIIDEIGQNHTQIIGVIQRRAGSIKAILNYWQNGSVSSAINALNMMNDPCVTTDVLNSTFAQDLRVEMLNFENVANLLPHTMLLVNSKYENHIMAGLNSTMNILKHFAPQMIQLKTVSVGRGVDISREERLKKCDACIEQFASFRECRGFKKALNRGDQVSVASQQLDNQLLHLLNAVRAEQAF